MGLRGEAAIVGYTELPATKKPAGPPEFTLEQWAWLASAALADAGLSAADVDGICTGHLQESQIFVPDGHRIPRREDEFRRAGRPRWGQRRRDGVSAAAAIELGLCNAVLCVVPATPLTPVTEKRPPDFGDMLYFGASSNRYGSPQAEFEIPTATWDRTACTGRSPRSTAPPTATTNGRWPRSASTSGSTPTTPRRHLRTRADHRRRRRQQPGDRVPAAHARDRDAGDGRRGGAGDRRRSRAAFAESPGVDQGVRRTGALQDAHLRPGAAGHPDDQGRRLGILDGRPHPPPTWTWCRSTTATPSRRC